MRESVFADCCIWCGKALEQHNRTREHIIPTGVMNRFPQYEKHRDDPNNLRLACVKCNHDRGEVYNYVFECARPSGPKSRFKTLQDYYQSYRDRKIFERYEDWVKREIQAIGHSHLFDIAGWKFVQLLHLWEDEVRGR